MVVDRPHGEHEDYASAHVLLPFVAGFVQARSPYTGVSVELVRDGALRVRLSDGGKPLSLLWMEAPRRAAVQVTVGGVAVAVERPQGPRNGRGRERLEGAARHVARRLGRLLQGDPPHLLLWRNRNLERLHWGVRMFNGLCPDLLVRGHTRYFDYTVAGLDEYEGFMNVEFRSRAAAVVLRLVPTGIRGGKALAAWGPISLVLLRDERTPAQRKRPEHRVEEFLGYILSRNLPPEFVLEFERNDPPSGHLPEGFEVDFIRSRALDDTGFFEMLLGTSEEIGVVTSCDRECFNLFSFLASSREGWTTNHPWQARPAPGYLEHCYNVSLDSRSTVLGSENIERCLETLRSAETRPGLIIFIDSCLQRLIGEDVDGPVARFRAGCSLPLVHYDIRTTQHPYLQQLKDFWKNVLRELADRQEGVRVRRVAFLGQSPDSGGEMERLLGQMGVETGARLFPGLRVADVRRLPSCGLVVVNEWEYVQTIFADLLQELDRPALALPLPYGIEGTSRWLDAVAGAVCGKGVSVQGVEDARRIRDESAAELEAERARLGGARVGVFVRYRDGDRDAVEQMSPRLRFGVPLCGFLHELGLGIDLNLFVGPREDPDAARVAQAMGLRSGLGDSVGVFRSTSELPEKLERGEFALVYTETFRDARITAAGKTPLHLNQIRPGYRGAVRTARLVRGLLRSAFHARYRRYFEPPAAHDRRPEGA
ncbi:MAG: nitrogenase component 1 [Myxococcota bacterium]|nr:nitrogenase component 1 [Myxococcota bacterium]